MKKLLPLILGGALSISAAADSSQGYIGTTLSVIGVDTNNGYSFNPATASIRAGVDLNEHAALEARLGTGITDAWGGNYLMNIDRMASGFLVLSFAPSNASHVYVLLGGTKSTATLSHSSYGSEQDSESDLSYGAGFNLQLANKVSSLTIEAIKYIDTETISATGFSLGFKTHF